MTKVQLLKQLYYDAKDILKTTINVISNLKCIFVLLFSSKKNNQPLIIFSARNFNHGRYAFQLLNYLNQAGYQISVYKSFRFLLFLKGYDRLIFKIPNLTLFRKSLLKKNGSESDCMHISVNCGNINYQFGKKFVVNYDVFDLLQKQQLPENNIFFPYYTHPLMQNRIHHVRNLQIKKSAGVLFYGNKDLHYDSFWIDEYFKKISRARIAELISQSSLPIIKPKTLMDLYKVLNGDCKDQIVFINSNLFTIPADDWLNILSRFTFFVASPGGCMPLAHNLIEAMALNVIPILQHPEFFYPKLIDGVTCMSFSDEITLFEKLEQAIKLNLQDTCSIQKNLEEYYNAHISPIGMRKKIENLKAGTYTLKFNAEELSLHQLRDNLAS